MHIITPSGATGKSVIYVCGYYHRNNYGDDVFVHALTKILGAGNEREGDKGYRLEFFNVDDMPADIPAHVKAIIGSDSKPNVVKGARFPAQAPPSGFNTARSGVFAKRN